MTLSGNYNHQNHLEFFGLSHNPFPVAPDNTDFYISQQNDKIITVLTQAILSRKGFMLLTGEIGLGKTTLSRKIIHILEQHHVETSLILQSFFQGENLLKEIIQDFGIKIEDTQNDLSPLMTLLNDFLLEKNQAGINCAILIDDAQNLNIESLELVRMISNLETDREKLVQILLVGQPELMEKLNSHELRQLKSRVTTRQKPVPLKKLELGKYIQFKLNMAGDTGKLILKKKTLQKLYKLTCGNLRKINILMDHALHQAFANKTHVIKPEFIAKANKELAFDIPENKNNYLAFPFIILLLILIMIGMVGGTGAFYFYLNKNKTTTGRQNIIVPKPVPTAKTSKNQIPVPATIASATENKEAGIKYSVPDSVISFFSAYGLESFAIGFHQAQTKNNLKDIRDTIFDQTGLQLIKLDNISSPVREKYDILSSIHHDSQTPVFYLFWKPWLKIKKFYSGFRGEEISDLQKLLAKFHLYNYDIDGIVGQIMVKSVKEFQRQHHLPVTGFPDPETIFLLSNINKKDR
jgi:general secretion pathway protein A